MKIFEAFSPSRAWCVDRKGNAVPVRVHPFGAMGEDSIEDAAWLYMFTDYKDKSKLVKYIANAIVNEYAIGDYNDAVSTLNEELRDIESLKGNIHINILCEDCSTYLATLMFDPDEILSDKVTKELGREIKNYLNENYMRVRYGSHYQSFTEREGAMYFRTSSTDGFNWYNIIVNFLDTAVSRFKIREVTIERDTSSTGYKKLYVDHLPLSEFLMKKPEVIECVKRCGTIKEESR